MAGQEFHRGGIRFAGLEGAPKYLAMYDLAAPDVLGSPEYDRVAGNKFRPWIKRVTSRVKIYRSAGAQVYPGNQIRLVEARAPIDAKLDLAAFGGHADALDLINTYAPY